jgi:hypothetical protein
VTAQIAIEQCRIQPGAVYVLVASHWHCLVIIYPASVVVGR